MGKKRTQNERRLTCRNFKMDLIWLVHIFSIWLGSTMSGIKRSYPCVGHKMHKAPYPHVLRKPGNNTRRWSALPNSRRRPASQRGAELGRFGHKPWTSHDINDISSLFTSSSWNLACNFKNRRDQIFELGPERARIWFIASFQDLSIASNKVCPKILMAWPWFVSSAALPGNVGFVQRSGAPGYGIPIGGTR